MPVRPSEVESIFREAGAFLEGHFVLASGRHSDQYLEKFQVLQWPRHTERLAAAIAEWAGDKGVDTIAGPTTGGIILAHEVARQMGIRAVYAERDEERGRRALRRGFRLRPGERVLVVDDIMSTGGSVEETVRAVEDGGGEVVGVAVLADRSGGYARSGSIPYFALWEVEMKSYEPVSCPQCALGVPAVKPGTTPADKVRA